MSTITPTPITPTPSHRYCLALDLKDNPELIKQYCKYHAEGHAWPEITDSIRTSGILNMEIYLTGNRLFMIMETTPAFSFMEKQSNDRSNAKVQEWEQLMDQFQLPLPWAKTGEKWVKMEKIYQLPLT